MRIDFVRFSSAAMHLLMWQALVFIPLEMCLYFPLQAILYILTLGLTSLEVISERFIHVLALRLDLQMLVSESLIPTTIFNFSAKFVEIEKGTRFPPDNFSQITNPTLREVEKFTDRTQRDRGSFGSSSLWYQRNVWQNICEQIHSKTVPEDLLWYERDDLMTYIGQLK